jgi:hypothetical protein
MALVQRPMFNLGDLKSIGVSLGLHVVALILMSLITFQVAPEQMQMVLDSVFAEDRAQEEFQQEVEQNNDVATTMNVIAGGVVSQTINNAGGAAAAAQEKIDRSESLKEPTEVRVNAGDISAPGLEMLGDDLGEGEVAGEPGRVVEGYGAALSQVTQELIRLMRESKVLVVWLFDESDSMRDDQKEIREKFQKVYEELGLAQKQDTKLKYSDEVLQTAILSFGKNVQEHTAKPTSDVATIKAAIDKIAIDESGIENTCMAVSSAIDKYRTMANRSKRKLAIIVVSDESGDDGDKIEETIERAKRASSPVFILGRYSVFGYPYLRTTWVDKETGLEFYPLINRGPETAMPELLQYDGFHERWDYDSSGFGPYEQSRLARESGGIFFLLPTRDESINRQRSHEDLKFELLDMKEYLPNLDPRTKYLRERDGSKFRSVQWEVVKALNPHLDDQLRVDTWHYPPEPDKFKEFAAGQVSRVMRSMRLLNDAVQLLDSVKPLRAKEASARWRANYDMIHAQCLAFRVRQFQYLLAVDAHAKNKPEPTGKNNMWYVNRIPQMKEPDTDQIKQTKVDMTELKRQEDQARDEFKAIIATHPRTPWARRAEFELNLGCGIEFRDRFHDPRYKDLSAKIKVPKQ